MSGCGSRQGDLDAGALRCEFCRCIIEQLQWTIARLDAVRDRNAPRFEQEFEAHACRPRCVMDADVNRNRLRTDLDPAIDTDVDITRNAFGNDGGLKREVGGNRVNVVVDIVQVRAVAVTDLAGSADVFAGADEQARARCC